MSSDLLQGFQLGRWRVEPLRGAVTGPDGEARHLEPKVMDVFVLLASRANELVTREELLEAVWQGRAVTDEPLTRAIGELRRALQHNGGEQQYIETVPKRGYRLTGEVLPVGGEAAEHEFRAGTVFAHISWKPAIGVAVVAAVFVFLAYHWFVDNLKDGTVAETTAPEASIAVLPFVNISDDPDQEYFSDGLSEEILSLLSRVPGLTVIARTSSFAFKGKNEDVRVIGQKLGVRTLLEGSVRKSGDRLRIAAQLIDASSGTHIWSGSYDRQLEEIFLLQDEISVAIVGALEQHLGLSVDVAPRVTAATNIEAHDAYLLGRYLLTQLTRTSIEGAIRQFEKAIELDPDYALAHAELAIANFYHWAAGYARGTDTEWIASIAPHAERALALDPKLAESHAATAVVLWLQLKLDEAQTHFRRAIGINPNYAAAHTLLGQMLYDHGLYAESFDVNVTGLRLDPLSRHGRYAYIDDLIHRNRFAEAERELEKLALIHPAAHAVLRGKIASNGGNWADAILGLLESLRFEPDNSSNRGILADGLAILGLAEEALAVSQPPFWHVYRRLGRPDDAVALTEAALLEDPTSAWAAKDLGLALAGAGDFARARPFLEETWRQSGGRVTSWGVFLLEHAAALIAARRAADDDASVGEIVAAIKDNVRRYREAGITGTLDLWWHVDFEDGLASYLAGDRDQGLALIAKAVREGATLWPNVAYLQELYDDPDFAPIDAIFEARQARERARLLSVVCFDNPYADVWQPADETCEGFATAAIDDAPAPAPHER